MSCAREIKALFSDATVAVTTCTLSFVNCMMPTSYSSKSLLLHRERKHPAKRFQLEATLCEDLESTLLDTTGSPLEYELDYPQVDETIVDNRNWKKTDEFYLPLTTLEARLAINCCLEELPNQDWSMPLLAICDGKDNDRTVLFGSYVESGWFTTIQGRCMDARRLSDIKETPASLLEQYTDMNSLQKYKVVSAVSSTYELCGRRPGVTDLSDLYPDSFNGNLSVEINWNTPSFYAPIRDSTTTLNMEIVAGWDGSCLKRLWRELTLLHHFLNMLTQCKPNELNSHKWVPLTSVTWDEIQEKLNSLLNGENETASFEDDNNEDHGDDADNCKLKNHIDSVQFRQNMDFADMLWELMIGCTDNVQVTSCFRVILDKIQRGLATPQIAPTNSSRIAKIISEVLCQRAGIPMLGESLPLELLIDTGLEKLCRDYKYILIRSNLIDIYDTSQIFHNIQGEPNIESYGRKLASLGQVHLCLAFTLFAENCRELQCQSANLQSIFMRACQEYASENSAIESFSVLLDNEIRCLNVSLPTVAVEHIAKGLPSSWRLTLSSDSTTSRITTTSHLSRNPILPPNIYSLDELNEHEVYHFLKVDTASFKIA